MLYSPTDTVTQFLKKVTPFINQEGTKKEKVDT